MNKNFLTYLKFFTAIIFSCILIFAIFIIYDNFQYSHFKKICTDSNLKNLHITEIKEKFEGYPFSEDEYYGKLNRNNDKIIAMGFSVTNIPFDFRTCVVSYDKETGKVDEIHLIKD